jgi:Fe-S-cluster containining protein
MSAPLQQDAMLPVIESCDGCGVCCLEQNSPPGYGAVICASWGDEEDNERVRNMSPEARAVLDEYLERLKRHEVNDGVPCCWYDKETKGCRFYDERPSICRDFERSSEGCHSWRKSYGVGEAE